MMSSHFSVATNFDDTLPAQLRPYEACEVFGKLPHDIVGGGRASYMLSPVSKGKVETHVREARKHGLAFDYLINAACLGNSEFSSGFHRRLRHLLDWVAASGVEWVTVSLPSMLEIVKTRYPQLKVKVGVYAQVDTPTRARFWEDLGADCITLVPLTVNRDFPRLRAIREAVRCDLQLLANSTCMKECPLAYYHNVELSHASQSRGERFMIDYCLLKCSTVKLSEPAHYLMSPWIRPEDIHHYEALGYSVFKILERDAPTATLVERTRAYHERHFDGNLIDLIQPYGYTKARSATQPGRKLLWDFRTFFRPWKARTTRLLRWREFAMASGMAYQTAGAPVVIDNRSLDGFLDGVMERECGSRDCARCRYCHTVARDVVKIDPDYRERCLTLATSGIAISKTRRGR
ncbi:MAG TPA: U32 family peptidase [Armatimonadota bacterium]|nr:U32 family peptidase [Armatimonadota bacterium]